MISRRSLLGTGAAAIAVSGAVVVADATHRLDDIARAVGMKPRARPVASDDTLIAAVAKAQNRVLAAIESTVAQHPDLEADLSPISQIVQQHVTAVGGSSTVPTTSEIDADAARAVEKLTTTLARASKARAKDANAAVSPDLARVLSSMSAGLAQGARILGALA